MQPSYQITIHDRAYNNWSFVCNNDGTSVEHPKLNPISNKLFSKDVFIYEARTDEDLLAIIYSPIRSGISIPGILILENNKTYGRTISKKRLLYKCIPNDSNLPPFLVPYDIQLGFSKTYINKYVLFKFDNWNETHPQGILVETLGDVDTLNVYYEYQLHCKNIHSSITNFTNKTRQQINTMDDAIHTQILNDPNFHVENRLFDKYIFTIDPAGSTDFDDAFSFHHDINAPENTHLSIYIANVYVWLEKLGLWDFFSDRVSSIYLPDKKRTMLPPILSDSLCSLQAGEHRFAFVMDIQFNATGEMIHTFKNVMIKVKQNYVYDSDPLLANTRYKSLYEFTRKLNPDMKDSHDLVAYWMIHFNTECAKYMANNRIGIQRVVEKTIVSGLPAILSENHTTGKYILFDSVNNRSLLPSSSDIVPYTHITSPIRRLPDLLNQICIITSMGLVHSISTDCLYFMQNWMKNIAVINEKMRAIRKTQNTCELLYRCTTVPSIIDCKHTGILFDKKRKKSYTSITEEGIDCFTYNVYLEDLKLISKFKTYTEYAEGNKYKFKLYVFHDEYKQKIRVQLIE